MARGIYRQGNCWAARIGWRSVKLGYFREYSTACVVRAAAEYDREVARMLGEDLDAEAYKLRADIKRIPLVSKFQEQPIRNGVRLRHKDRAEFLRWVNSGDAHV